MTQAREPKLFRWIDKDEEFFALFVWVDEVVEEGRLPIHVIEEISLLMYPKDNIIIRHDFFGLLFLLKLLIVVIRFQITSVGV